MIRPDEDETLADMQARLWIDYTYMKRCPQCRRDYHDDTLSFCLEDGSPLVYGVSDDPATAIMNEFEVPPSGDSYSESQTRAQIYPTASEAEPKGSLSSSLERQSLSAHRAAEPHERSGINKFLLGTFVLAVVALGGFFGYRYFRPAVAEQISSIAVLPFENKSGNADSEYLSDGLAESLIYRLSQLPNLKVSARSLVFRYKGKDIDPAAIGSELGVDALMSGRVIQRGDSLTISVDLVDTRNGKTIWGEQYERKMSDLLATQREIASEITDKLQLKLSGDEAKVLTKRYTDNNDAYQAFLKGRFYGSKRTAKDAQQAIEYYQQAVTLDPKFALAYAGLSEANWFLALYSYPQVNEAIPKARELALKALEVDNSLAEPHSILGVICFNADRDFACMERETKLAIELNPNYPEGHRRYGLFLQNLGRFEEAHAATRRALEIDPLSPVANLQMAQILFYQKKYEESEAMSKKNIELDPNFWYGHWQLFYGYRMKGDYAAAVEELAKTQESRGEPDAAKFIRESFAAGDWRKFLSTITAGRARLKLYPYFVSTFFAELGEKDKAFEMLNEALETTDQHVGQMKVDPFMDPLRDDPRFPVLLRRVGFTE